MLRAQASDVYSCQRGAFKISSFSRGQFHSCIGAAFTSKDPESAKKYRQVVCLLCAFGICGRKSCS